MVRTKITSKASEKIPTTPTFLRFPWVEEAKISSTDTNPGCEKTANPSDIQPVKIAIIGKYEDTFDPLSFINNKPTNVLLTTLKV